MEKTKAIYAVLAALTIWCCWNSANIGKNSNSVIDIKAEQLLIDRKVSELIEKLETENKETEKFIENGELSLFDSMDFKEIFSFKRSQYGSGYIFEWRGDYYTTDYMEEVTVKTTAIVGGWVLNGNDSDDWCSTNDRDECGTCGGDGAVDWYADRDGDGLGDKTTMRISCQEPTASAE